MGTYQLLTALWKHWSHPVSPIYRADMRYGPPWAALNMERWSGRVARTALALLLVALSVTAARALTNEPFFSTLYMVLLPAMCLSSGSVLLIALVVLTFLWPIAIAVAASGTIVREREHRTWAALLTTPLDWNDLLTAKLASSLRWLNRPCEMLVWVQGILLSIVLILVIGQSESLSASASPLVAVLISIVAGAQFAIARVQDYTTATVIGLGASMISETRQSASIMALIGGLFMIVSRTLLTAVFLFNIPPSSPQGVLILLSTGPTTVIVMAFQKQPFAAILLLIAIPLVREYAIRYGYRWTLGHLGQAAGNG